VQEKNFLAFFLIEHHILRKKGRIGKDQVVNFLRTDMLNSHYTLRSPPETSSQANLEKAFQASTSLIHQKLWRPGIWFPNPGRDADQ
jgi:small-conductance mechanosensitive channel